MTDEQFGSRFRAISDWCSRNNKFSAGWPNFLPVSFPSGNAAKEYEHYLIRDEYVVWRDVKEKPTSDDAYHFTDLRTRFSAAHDYAQRNGYDHAFPNFHQADYGEGTVYGMFLIKDVEFEIKDILVSDLFGDYPAFLAVAPTDPTRIPMVEWFRAASNYVRKRTHEKPYIAAMPTGHHHYDNANGIFKVKVILFIGEESSSDDSCSDNSKMIEFKKIRGKELNLPDVAQTRAVKATLKSFRKPSGKPYPDDSKERKFAVNAVNLIELIVNDKEFIERVRQGKYSRARFETENFGEFKDPIPNEEIVKLILNGKEQVSQNADKEIDIRVKISTKLSSNVYGSTPHHKLRFRTNKKFFNRWHTNNDPLSLAAHWLHEWLHVAGFRHIYIDGDPDRQDAVYKIARFAIKEGKKHVEANQSLKSDIEPGSGYLELEHRQNMDGYIEKTFRKQDANLIVVI